MEMDMLSLLKINHDTNSLAKKISRMAALLIFVSSVYGILSLYEWYLIYEKSKTLSARLPHYEFNYLVRPGIACVVILVSLFGYVLNYKAYLGIKTAFENGDHLLFNQGFKSIYHVFILTITAFVIMVLTTLYQYIFL